jgi:hypothetical protein
MIPRSIGSIVKGFKIGVTKWFRNNTDIYTTIASFDLSTKVVPAQGKTNFYDYCEKQAPKRSYHGFYANDTKIVLSTISSNFPIDKFTNTIDKFTYYQERTIDQLLFKQIIKMGLTVKQPSKKITSIDSLLTEIASLFKGNALVLSAAWKRLPSELQEDLWSNAQQFIQNHGKKDLVAEITKINNYKLTDDSYVPETIININSLATQNKQLIIIHNNEQIPFDSFKTIFFDKDNQLLTIKPGEVNNYMLTPLTIHVPTSPAITKKKDVPKITENELALMMRGCTIL